MTLPGENGEKYDYILGETRTFEMSEFDVDDGELSVNYSAEVSSSGSASTSWVTVLPNGLGV